MGDRMCAEHEQIRDAAERLTPPTGEGVQLANELGRLVNAHVRFEERELFELMEARVDADAIEALGRAIDKSGKGRDA
jgi:hypothetical protein